MNNLSHYATLFVIGFALALSAGCGKKSGAQVYSAIIEAASSLPGAADVMAAIDKKDYDGAMAALMKIKKSVTGDEQTVQFMILARQARDKMDEAAPTDPKAAEAVMSLRAMTTGGR